MKNILGRANLSKLLIVLALLVIGGAATVYTYYTGKDKPVASDSGWTEYKNEKFGFKFEYPKSWGLPKSVEKNTADGIEYVISFNRNTTSINMDRDLPCKEEQPCNIITKAKVEEILSSKTNKFYVVVDSSSYYYKSHVPGEKNEILHITQIVNIPKIQVTAAIGHAVIKKSLDADAGDLKKLLKSFRGI